MVISPLITQTLRDIYGWRGTLLLFSALCMQSIPLSAVVKNPKVTVKESAQGLLTESEYLSKGSNVMDKIARSIGTQLLKRPEFVVNVVIPAFAFGYTMWGWLIYIVSFALSNDGTLRQASIVATCGGVGMIVTRGLILPVLQILMTYKQLIYMSSVITTLSIGLTTQFTGFVGMCAFAVVFGVGIGIFGVEIYVAGNVVAGNTQEQYQAVAWYHIFVGIGSMTSGFLTGKSTYNVQKSKFHYKSKAFVQHNIGSLYDTMFNNGNAGHPTDTQ